jgi:hypothetical protein
VKLSNNSFIILYVGQPYTQSPPPVITDNFVVSPNPAHQFLKVGKDNTVSSDYIIHDATGHLMSWGSITTNSSIRISHLPAGVYFIKLTQKGVSKTLRFFKW